MAEIGLTRGHVALIDDADLPFVSGRSWYAQYHPSKHRIFWYAVTRTGGQHIYMHRLLLGLKPGDPSVDHVDGNGLNNRRGNIRLATSTQNHANSNGKPHYRKSKWKGVDWKKDQHMKAGGRWRASIKVHGKQISRPARTEIEAALAYNQLAIEHFGSFARLNAIDI